jgi:ParB family chromosome partitioning protein
MAKYKQVALAEIAPPPAPVRAVLDDAAIIDLADSIRDIGLQQPLIIKSVAKAGKGGDAGAPENGVPSPGVPAPRYEIIAGHRRYLACKHLGLEKVDCCIFAPGKVSEAAVMLHENIYRVDLTAAEEGLFYAELIEKHDCTEAELCKMVRQAPEYIYARLDLVRGDPEILHACLERKVNFSVAKELNRCKDETQRRYFLSIAVNGGATWATVHQWIQKMQAEPAPAETVAGQPVESAVNAQPTESGLRCWFCARQNDPHHMVLLYIHFYELDVLKRTLAGMGIEVAG